MIKFKDGDIKSPYEIQHKLQCYLEDALDKLPELIQDESLWQSKFINYEFPHVSRLYRKEVCIQGEYYLSIHEMESIPYPYNALYHNHDYPLLIKVLSGVQLVQFGYKNGSYKQENFAFNNQYIMESEDQYHSVTPLTPKTLSLMITYKQFAGEKRHNQPQLQELSTARKFEILETVKTILSKS